MPDLPNQKGGSSRWGTLLVSYRNIHKRRAVTALISTRMPLTTNHKNKLYYGDNVQRPLHVREVTFKKAPRSRPQAAENLSLPLE